MHVLQVVINDKDDCKKYNQGVQHNQYLAFALMKLVGIAIKQKKRGEMLLLQSVNLGREFGLKGDYRGRPGKRQVTVLSQDSWADACRFLDVDLPWTTRRANLLIDSRAFSRDDLGRIISIGDARLQITRETDPCGRMDDASYGLKEALQPDWRGGVCCRVKQEGLIQIGLNVEIS